MTKATPRGPLLGPVTDEEVFYALHEIAAAESDVEGIHSALEDFVERRRLGLDPDEQRGDGAPDGATSMAEFAEQHIRSLEWSIDATEHEKTLVEGNLRHFSFVVSRDFLPDYISDDCDALRAKLSGLLTRTANALKGEPRPLHSHSWHDLPEIAAATVEQAVRHGKIAKEWEAACLAADAQLHQRGSTPSVGTAGEDACTAISVDVENWVLVRDGSHDELTWQFGKALTAYAKAYASGKGAYEPRHEVFRLFYAALAQFAEPKATPKDHSPAASSPVGDQETHNA